MRAGSDASLTLPQSVRSTGSLRRQQPLNVGGENSARPPSSIAVEREESGRSSVPAIMIAMPTAEIYTLLLAGLLVGGVLWVVSRFIDRD